MTVTRDVLDTIMHRRSSANPGSDLFGTIDSYAQTPAEAGITLVSLSYLPGVIDRYGTNAVPGTTNMSPAMQAAINVALASNGSVAVRGLAAAYSIATPLTFGSSSNAMLLLDIGGQGNSTQFINNITASTSALFPLSGKNGWYLHDFLMCGNSAHKNDGIHAGETGGTEQIRWRIERVTSMMAGIGLRVADTNTSAVVSFRGWPNNPPALIVPQAVTASDINHHVYLTGGFVHEVSFKDLDCLPQNTYASGQRGFKMDCATSRGVSIINSDFESNGGANTETGIEIAPSGSVSALTLVGIYHEGTIISIKNAVNCNFFSLTDGDTGGSLILVSGTRNNTFSGINVAVYNNQDPTNFGNMFLGMIARTTWTDSADAANISNQPNEYRGCTKPGASVAARGTKWRKILAFASTITPDTYSANINVIRASGSFTLALPANPYNGQEVEFTIRNESAGAITVTFSGYFTAGWVNPAAGFNRSISFYYDSDFGQWRQRWVGTVDITN